MTWGTKGEASVHMAARPKRVYELVSDVSRMGEWSPETYRCTWVDADGPAVGARFRAHNRRGSVRWSNTPQVIAADPGREFAFRRTAPAAGEVIWRYRMEPDASGTMVTESYEVVRPPPATMTWIMGVLSRLLLHITDRDADLADGMYTTLTRIKLEAERMPDPTRASRSSR